MPRARAVGKSAALTGERKEFQTTRKEVVQNIQFHSRRTLVIVSQLTLVALANHVAFLLRFDGSVPSSETLLERQMLPWLLLVRGIAFARFGLYRGMWRYSGIWELRDIFVAVVLSSVAFSIAAAAAAGPMSYPRSVIVIDALVVTCFLGGIRLLTRLRRGRALVVPGRNKSEQINRRLLIYGAGAAGESIVRDILHRALDNYTPVGFVDDDTAKVGHTIHGVPVVGTRSELRRIMADRDPDEVLIAMPAADLSTVRGVVRSLEPFKVRITILPNLRDILDGTVRVNQIRRLAVEDLLPRVAVGIDQAPLRHMLAGRRVMVTGAGGSIGSELCHQIVALGPESLVLYERAENSLYAVINQLADRGASARVHPALGDVTDVDRLERVLAQFRPEIIFHAAAHKHVPLMEAHPCEAVKNNVLGTRLVAEAAQRHGVARFILVSTDKAVNPTSVMGATKRIAELIVMNLARQSATTFMTVRFGNVLGSTGSAIPRFIEQIKSGGPVTITHPEMRRYFMLLPEAAQLVLHVAGRGRNQGVYVLDMGEQIKVVDMARNLIQLSGFVPDEDIKLTYVGLRPGEKLFEELVGSNETVGPSSIEKVFEVTSEAVYLPDHLEAQVRRLERFARQGNSASVMRLLSLIVPGYAGRPWDLLPAELPVGASAPQLVSLRAPVLGT
jgi:FlaA1/EpsC-like NDP-sugar epimerase